MLDRLIERVGDSNPQIFRELKERLTLRNIGVAVAGFLVIQVLVFSYFNSRSDIFGYLSWILSLGLILGSVYLLVADLVRERKRGTLNSIRLSPQSAPQVFIGKILSVPILIYVAAAAMLPLHLLMGLGSGRTLPLLAGWYVTIGAMWFLLSSVAVLYVLLGGMQAILTIVATAYPIYLLLMTINFYTLAAIDRDDWFNRNRYTWFGLPFTSSAILFNAFGIGCCLVASYWVWQVLDRRYRNPTGTRIGKSQSYLINLCLQVWIAGLAIPASPSQDYFGHNIVMGLAAIDFVALLLLRWMLLPSQQALQDVRYCRERVTHQRRTFVSSKQVQDLMNNESPPDLAIGINIFIVLALWLPLLAMGVFPRIIQQVSG